MLHIVLAASPVWLVCDFCVLLMHLFYFCFILAIITATALTSWWLHILCLLQNNRSVVCTGSGVSWFSRGSLEWNNILEICVLQLLVTLEMLHDFGTKVSCRAWHDITDTNAFKKRLNPSTGSPILSHRREVGVILTPRILWCILSRR